MRFALPFVIASITVGLPTCQSAAPVRSDIVDPASTTSTGDDASAPAPGAREPTSLPEPHPDIPVGTKLTLYTGPRFITGEAFLPEAAGVIADELGRVRALVRTLPEAPTMAIVKLPGALAVAGLHDAHVHTEGVGARIDQVSLLGMKTPAEMKKRVAAFARAHPDAAAVRGRGWDQSRFQNGAWPTAADLDGVTTKPVFLTRVDGHAGLANKALLKLAGVDKSTSDPAGGRILRDADGAPTRVLIDSAMSLVEPKLPPPSPADRERWLVAGLTAFADAGLVAVHDMGMSVDSARILMKLDDAGKLPVRVFVYLDGTDEASYGLLGTRPPSERLEIVGVKLYADGAMGSRGAALLEDYADEPGQRGLLITEPAVLEARIKQVQQKGFQAAIHAIGDRGNHVVVTALAAAEGNDRSARHRVEHAQLIAPDDFALFARTGVIASMQPTHATSDMRWAEARVGRERLKGAYAWRTMLDKHIPLAFGSDAPIESERPVLGLYAAITRQDDEGNPPGGFLPDQRLTEAEALHAFAAGAAYAVHHERDLGALTPGMFFDVSLFDKDPHGAAPKWLQTKPVGTVVGGKLRATPKT